MNIANYIPRGRENAITRRELADLTHIPDRQIRELVKRANKELAGKGEAILSSSNKAGYWISDDPAEIRAYIAESDRRIKTQLQNDLPVRQILTGHNEMILVRPYMRRLHAEEPEEPELTGQAAFW